MGIDNQTEWIAIVPVLRSRGLTRALLWSASLILLGGATWLIYAPLSLRATGMDNRLVDLGIAVVASPLAFGAMASLVLAGRWLLLAIWPGPVRVEATTRGLTLKFGPFGTKHYAAAQLLIRYPFESDDLSSDGFEAFLPEEKQRASLVPKITHAGVTEPINRTILRFVGPTESEVAQRLRPAIDYWQSINPKPGDDSEID